ncbi:MAG: hypothetical protein ORN49_05245 [Rhodobacteraceae bacterium]|nr:hypothetical protein [Paracoccaceae bacterium]
MIRSFIIALGLSVVAATAQAQGIEGGQVGLSYDHNSNHGTSQTSLGGSVAFGLGSLSLQGDLSKRINSNAPGAVSIGAHAITGVGADSALGAFLTYDNRSGATHDYNWGVEGKFAAGRDSSFGVEGYVMRVTRDAGRSNFNALGVDAKLGFGASSAVKAGFFSSDGSKGLSRYSVGFSQELAPNLTVDLDAARQNSGSHRDSVLGLSVAYKFGNGATFSSRSYPQMVPGF